MLTTVACFFGSTIVENRKEETSDNVQYTTYRVIRTGLTGIRKRHCPLERLLMLLNPETRKLDFRHLTSMVEDAIERLRAEKDCRKSSIILSKINFLETINLLISEHVSEHQPFKQANHELSEYLQLCHPKYRRVYKSLEHDFYAEVTDEDQVEKFVRDFQTNNAAKCYSGFMTIADSIKFWSHPNSIQNFDNSSAELRCSIIKLLLGIRNSSGIERQFTGLKRNAAPHRPRLDHSVLFHEHFLRTLCSQCDILLELSDERNIEKRMDFIILFLPYFSIIKVVKKVKNKLIF